MHDDETLDEEHKVMEERSSHPPAMTADVFHQPISILCKRPVQTLPVTATVREALEMMKSRRFGAVVITVEGRLAGIITERDLMMKVAGHEGDVLDRPVTAVMTPNPESLQKGDELFYLMNKMHVGGFRHVPIVNEQNEPIHVISIKDVARFILDHFHEQVVLVPPDPYRGPKKVHSG
jgi:CBS domain-containing protein